MLIFKFITWRILPDNYVGAGDIGQVEGDRDREKE
jgi:hypothetical protein